MNLDFTRVTYDDDLDDFSEDRLRELVREFEDAQTHNRSEFESAADAITDEVMQFEAAKEELIETITDSPTFSELPLTEDSLEDADFSELRDWHDFVTEDEPSGGADDFGNKSPELDDGNEFSNEVDERLGSIPGVNAK